MPPETSICKKNSIPKRLNVMIHEGSRTVISFMINFKSYSRSQPLPPKWGRLGTRATRITHGKMVCLHGSLHFGNNLPSLLIGPCCHSHYQLSQDGEVQQMHSFSWGREKVCCSVFSTSSARAMLSLKPQIM